MKVWLVQTGEPLPCDGQERLLRTGLMAQVLARCGHDVTWWASTFDHVRKQRRFEESTSYVMDANLELRMLKSPGYSSNLSIGRLIDHISVARGFRDEASERPEPDVIVSSFPTLETSWVAETYGAARGIPVVIDVRDLWPDVAFELVPQALQPVARLLVSPYSRFAAAILRRATALTGLSPPFLSWAAERSGRTLTPWDRVFPMAYSQRTPAAERIRELTAFWAAQGVRKGADELTCCFFGALGHQFDLETVLYAARRLEESGVRCRFVICGAGERADELRELAKGVKSVLFPGWIDADAIWTLMRCAHIGLAPYRASQNFAMNFRTSSRSICPPRCPSSPVRGATWCRSSRATIAASATRQGTSRR